jgi:cardiolipin synthase
MTTEPSLPPTSLTVPNAITLIRILLTPLFVILLIQGRHGPALAVFLAASLSDFIDGLIARHWQQRSPLGTVLDPLADKLLLMSSFILLSLYRFIPPWLAVVVISRDFILVAGILILKLFDYPVAVRPTLAGKFTAAAQMITVFVVLLSRQVPLPGTFLKVWFLLTGALSAYSGIQYLARGLELGEQGKETSSDEGRHG